MTRRLKKLIKKFEFIETERNNITLGSGVRLDPVQQRLALASAIDGYPTAADLFAATRLTNPNRAKQWLLFQADVKNFKNQHGAYVTAVKYRLSSDGTTQLWWNGGAWTEASPGEWNTEAEISANLPTFSIANQSIQVVLNLSTTDPNQTPFVYSVKILYASDLEYQEEYIARSLMPMMREEILPISDYPVKVAAGATSLSLAKIETPYDIKSIDCVYNNTQDPNQLVDLYVSYDSATKVVSWSTPAALNDVIWVRFVYSPVMAMSTSQDYIEVAKVPAVLIESVDSGSAYYISDTEAVLDKTTNNGFQLAPGFQCDLDVSIRFTADKLKDLDRLSDQIKAFFNERLLRARGQDEFFRMYTIMEYAQAFSETQSELHSGRLRARICNAVFYPNDAKPIHGVQRFIMNGIALSEA